MPKSEKLPVLEDDATNVRWQIPPDAIKIIISHQRVLKIQWDRDNVTREEAVIDLIRNAKVARMVIVEADEMK
jgi:hypothetical protein